MSSRCAYSVACYDSFSSYPETFVFKNILNIIIVIIVISFSLVA